MFDTNSVNSIDELMATLCAFPRTPRPYRELYDLIISSHDSWKIIRKNGILFPRIWAYLGEKYRIEFHKGLVFNSLYITPPSGTLPNNARGIHILYRKIWHRQPVMSEFLKEYEGSEQPRYFNEQSLDMW